MHEFDASYWEEHWERAATGAPAALPTQPALPVETASLPRGTALDAGCGIGTEAIWLAENGWEVTGVDISRAALAEATRRGRAAGVDDRIEWVEADLTRWRPKQAWDLVVTNYAHAAIGQLALYQRLAAWVAPGGSLLIVTHDVGHGSGHNAPEHPEEATASPEAITSLLPATTWRVDSAYRRSRTVRAGGRRVPLHDVVVRARRLD